MGGACSTYGKRRSVYSILLGETLGKYQLEDPYKDGGMILKWIFRKWDGRGMCWIDLAEDRDRWQELVNAVMNLRIP
jgi:hypothetical protein